MRFVVLTQNKKLMQIKRRSKYINLLTPFRYTRSSATYMSQRTYVSRLERELKAETDRRQ